MKIYPPFLLILLTCFISGCEETDLSTSSLKSTAESKKKPIIHKQNKLASNKKPVKADQNQKTLNLTLPFEIKDTTNFTGSKNQRYLPDLFATNNKKHPLQVGGKIINKIEEEADKERTADGLGIDFNLSH